MKPDTHRLLDKYDEEYGLEPGSSYNLSSFMVAEEPEPKTNIQTRWKKWVCLFSSLAQLISKKKEN